MNTSREELRKFGLSVGAAFTFLGSISWYRGHEIPPLVLWTLGGLLIGGGAIAPALLAPVQRGWFRLAAVVGHFNMRIILGAFYFVVVTPIALLMRIIRDPLDRSFDSAASTYWHRREPQGADPARYENQF